MISIDPLHAVFFFYKGLKHFLTMAKYYGWSLVITRHGRYFESNYILVHSFLTQLASYASKANLPIRQETLSNRLVRPKIIISPQTAQPTLRMFCTVSAPSHDQYLTEPHPVRHRVTLSLQTPQQLQTMEISSLAEVSTPWLIGRLLQT